jgi:tyrosyl-tRNA synthetase
MADLEAGDILAVFEDVPAVTVPAAELESGLPLTELAVTAGVAASKGEAARLIRQGGLYVNARRATEERSRITMEDAIGREVIVLRKGQREHRLVRVGS